MATKRISFSNPEVLRAVHTAALAQADIDPAAPGVSVHVRLTHVDDRRETVTTLGGAEVTITMAEKTP